MTAEEREQGTIAYVALGSNIDDREHYLQDAITALNQRIGHNGDWIVQHLRNRTGWLCRSVCFSKYGY